MTQTSKFAYKARPKPCIHLATILVCLPHEKQIDQTRIVFVRLCQFCAAKIVRIKADSIMNLIMVEEAAKRIEADRMKDPIIRSEKKRLGIEIVPMIHRKPS